MDRITPNTKLTCLLGHPVSHSASPAIHNASYHVAGVDAIYLAFDVRDLERAVSGLQELGAVGCNITIPHKEEALRLATTLSEEVRLIGAINTLKFGEGGVEGYNTDVNGVLYSLELLDIKEVGEALLLGAGGAARAVVVALRDRVSKLVITSRSLWRAEGLATMASELGFESLAVPWERRNYFVERAELVVNATPVGTYGEGMPVDASRLQKGCAVFDLVYNPPDTPLVKAARQAECRALGGLPMLVRQAAESERMWFNIDPPEEAMMRAAKKFLGVENEGDGEG
ncbi:MAG: shikimate dehydrogenase [Candidatus Korarchaeota archaeon]|nr:shikimate dehydrogenase [Candidatus Korarchaeota archaeon]